MDPIPAWAQEIRERVVRIETMLTQSSGAKEMAQKALDKCDDNAEDIKGIKDNQTWLWRTIAGSIIAAFVAFFFRRG